MAFTRAWRAVVGAALAGGLVLASSSTASADFARDAQWPLTQYKALEKVWPISTGKGQIVAVIDTGVRASHVDLTGQVLEGTDFAYGGNGQTDHAPATEGHGTAMASLIAAHGHGSNGADGIKGLAPGAKILPIGIGPGNVGENDYVAPAIRYAVDHGATVINMSLGGGTFNQDDQDAVAYAEAHNVVLVAGTGNDGLEEKSYPADYPGVISVGGLTQDDTIWDGENYGYVAVVAPAAGIVADNNGSDTEMAKGDGTSNATAYVSAIAALVRAKYPQLTAGQVVNRIIKSAFLPSGITAPDSKWGYGIARPVGALSLNIPAGAATGPLPQATQAASAAASTGATTTAAAKGSSSARVLVSVAALAVVLVVVLLIVLLVRRRRNNRSGPGDGPGGGAGQYPPYPPQYGQPQQAYPSAYQQPNPYNQPPPQPPYNTGGQPR